MSAKSKTDHSGIFLQMEIMNTKTNEHRKIRIVEDSFKSENNDEYEYIWWKKPIAQKLLFAVCTYNAKIVHNQCAYLIISYDLNVPQEVLVLRILNQNRIKTYTPRYLKSWLLCVTFQEKGTDDLKDVIVVEDVSEQNTKQDIYWEGRELSQNIIKAIAEHRYEFIFHTAVKTTQNHISRPKHQCSIKHIDQSMLFVDKYLPALQYFADSQQLPTVVVFSNKMIAKLKDCYMVTVFIPHYRTKKLYPFNVYYSPEIGLYFINKASYDLYRERYGLPFLQLQIYNDNENAYDLRVESQLHMYGYSLESGNSAVRRQELLSFLIDNHIMKKSQIQNHIEWLIHTHRDRLHYTNACDKWKADLQFINEYNMKSQKVALAKGFDVHKS